MNVERRGQISKALALVIEARCLIEQARDDEREYFDNMPESFQEGDRGQQAEAVVDALDDAANGCEDIESHLETACE